VVPRKTRSLTVVDNIVEEPVVVELAKSINTYAEWGQKLKGSKVKDLTVQSLLDLCKGSKASRLESMKQISQAVAGEGSRWFTKKSGSANAMRRTTWFDLLLKSNIYQNEDHILGPSTVAIAKKLKEIIQKDELIIGDLGGAGLETLKVAVTRMI
ncbi:hypothetical protein Tco_1271956, partial [Tanacetum coccineum]